MIIAYVHFLSEALIGWQDQVYIHINSIKEGNRMAAGESYRGKNGTQGAMGFGGRLYRGASSSVCPEATAPLLCVFPMCCLLFLSANIPLQSGYVQHCLLFRCFWTPCEPSGTPLRILNIYAESDGYNFRMSQAEQVRGNFSWSQHDSRGSWWEGKQITLDWWEGDNEP